MPKSTPKRKKTPSLIDQINDGLRLGVDFLDRANELAERLSARRQYPPPQEGPVQPPALTPFDILGIPEDTSAKEIKARYRELARLYHPDSSRASDVMMKRINGAYEELKQMGRIR